MALYPTFQYWFLLMVGLPPTGIYYALNSSDQYLYDKLTKHSSGISGLSEHLQSIKKHQTFKLNTSGFSYTGLTLISICPRLGGRAIQKMPQGHSVSNSDRGSWGIKWLNHFKEAEFDDFWGFFKDNLFYDFFFLQVENDKNIAISFYCYASHYFSKKSGPNLYLE